MSTPYFGSPVMFTARQLAELVGGELRGEGDRRIEGASTLENAGPHQLALACDEHYVRQVSSSRAGAVIAPLAVADRELPAGPALVFVQRPEVAFATALVHLYPRDPAPAGVDARAEVAPGADVDSSASIGPFVYVGAGARIGPRTRLYPGVYIDHGASVGGDCTLYPGVTVYRGTRIGERVIIHASAVIGADGFGFVWDGERHAKVPQVGTTVVEDDCEIGAGCTIDRGALVETRIGAGTKLDNLIHVAHNVQIGQHCIFAAQVGIAGSSKLGDGVVLGGQVGVGGHLEVASGVRVGGQGGVAKSISQRGDYWGTPARPHQSWLRMLGSLARLPDLLERIRKLESRVEAIVAPEHQRRNR